MRRRWTITTHATGTKREVEMLLYDRLGDMRSATTRHSKAWDIDPEPAGGVLGVCHGFRRIHVLADGSEEEHPLSAIVRFTRGYVTPEIVSHEMAHAAQHLYGLDCIDEQELAFPHFDSGNEVFAHLLGELFDAAWSTLTAAEQEAA